MDKNCINIAIDGPAGAGKSTIAKELSKKLNIIYLDTGAMYRGVAYLASSHNLDVIDESAIIPLLENLDMRIEFGDIQQVIVNGQNITPYIREHKISKLASDISAIPAVRLKLVEIQREIAKNNNVVLDGRDIGTFVLPKAKFKFFITASPLERANRRYMELQQKGVKITKDEVLNDICSRDYNDSNRAFAPLVQADDAILLDTTDMDINQVVNTVLSYIGNIENVNL